MLIALASSLCPFVSKYLQKLATPVTKKKQTLVEKISEENAGLAHNQSRWIRQGDEENVVGPGEK